MPLSPSLVRIRPLTTAADYAACVALQELVWGAGDETIPPILLQVSQNVGAIAAGAFDPAGRMIGCVFGLTGLRNRRLTHWSHMLAVRPDARDQGIGRRLKRFQRARLLAMRVPTMHWTFDPLVARNAHLNLNRLGVTVEGYVPDMYGPGDQSPVDRGIGTDRLVVRWDLRRRTRRRAERPLPKSVSVRIEIPQDIHALRDRNLHEAYAWRVKTRQEFLHYLKRGYHVRRFHRGSRDERCFYLLARP
jgi:predicted GNAT superfamily acetyltransferase